MLHSPSRKPTKWVILVFICLVSFAFSNGTEEEFKSEFAKAYNFILNDNYEDAISILEKLRLEKPENANLKSMAGYCYLKSNNKHAKAIPVLEALIFPDDLTVNYKAGDSEEILAPLESLMHLGQAYHLNYEFEKAKKQFETYLSYLSRQKSDERYFAEKRLAEVNSALELTKNMDQSSILFSLNMTNSTEPEYRPIPNHNGEVMYFTSRRSRSGSSTELRDVDGKYYEDIYQAQYCRGVWSELETVSTLNTATHESILYLNPDETEILIYQFNGEDPNGGDIFEAKMVKGKWAPPTKLGLNINSKAWESHGIVTANKDIVFTSDRKGTKGFRDIWILHAATGEIENLGNNINSDEDEDGAFLANNGNTLYFSSNGYNTIGGFDIFKSEKNESGKWSEPVNMGMPINSPGDDIFYYPVVRGGDAYFSSFRKGGTGNQDIYFIANPDRIDMIVGIAKDDLGKAVADLDISIYEIETGKEANTIKTNSEGSFIFPLRPGQSYEVLPYQKVNERFDTEPEMKLAESNVRVLAKKDVQEETVLRIMELEKKGFAKITDVEIALSTSIAMAHFDALNPPVAINGDPSTDKDPEVTSAMNEFEFNSLFFVFDRITIIQSSKKDINLLAELLTKNKDFKIEITGHTDNLGNVRYNKRLSRERAKKVKRELIKLGVKADRITLNWVGAEVPLEKNQLANGKDNPAGRQQNRRTEFKLTK
jgi:outer membrane protein OmpA-like peptidoglycan-associated protein/cbb3-type cytochrome oxidase subunit 3